MNSEAIIYLNNLRGVTRSNTHRSFHCFNFGNYEAHNRNGFSRLHTFNDDTLMPQSSVMYSIPSNVVVFIMPVIGELRFQLSKALNASSLDVGESCVIKVAASATLAITNPYEIELVNFVLFWIATEVPCEDEVVITRFDLDNSANHFVVLSSSKEANVYAGKFSSRFDMMISAANEASDFFAFVIDGAFEFENRLIESKDGLSLKGKREVGFEALSDGAVLLLVEM